MRKLADFSTRDQCASRGNQSKFRIRDEFVKIDTYADGIRKYPEGLCEVLCSRLLDGIEHVEYQFCKIQVNERIYSGCISKNFIPDGAAEYTLQELYSKSGKSRKLHRILSNRWPYASSAKGFRTVIQDLQKMGVDSAEPYLYRQLFFDTVFQNTDRHTNNYSFLLMPDGKLCPAPLFDFGMAFGINSQFDPPKLFFPSGQEAWSFLEKKKSSWAGWGIPDHLEFSDSDFADFLQEAKELYTVNELEQVQQALCRTVLSFPEIFPNLDSVCISKICLH